MPATYRPPESDAAALAAVAVEEARAEAAEASKQDAATAATDTEVSSAVVTHAALKRGVHGIPASVGSGQAVVGDGSGGWTATDVIPSSQKGAASGVASLGSDSLVTPAQRAATYGTLAARPSAGTAGDRAFYYATDDNGGALSQVQSGAWVLMAPKNVELARTAYAVADDSARAPGFRALWGPTDATTPSAANTNFQMSWVSRGRPVKVEAAVLAVESGTATQFLWSFIWDLLTGTTSGSGWVSYPDLAAVPANGYGRIRPSALFTDAAGTARTVGVGGNTQAGTYTPKAGGANAILALLTATEV